MINDPWGGSEELWFEAAMNLVKSGVEVRACVANWSPLHAKINALRDAGVEVMLRERYPSRSQKIRRRLLGDKGNPVVRTVEAWLKRRPPALVVLSEGFAIPEHEFTEMLLANGWRYIAVAHTNRDTWWPYPHEIGLFRRGLEGAETVYFVSQANLKLVRKQALFTGDNAEIIRNPYSVDRAAPTSWPTVPATECLNMACVGRLDMRTKGQDVLVETLATDIWRGRNWRLNIYGEGDGRALLQRMICDAGLQERVLLKGHTPIADIWPSNHLLVQSSRAEGLPITIVEAMISGRPVLATDIAGNSELLEEGITGFVAGAPTVSQLSIALARAWDRRADLEEMGRAARTAVLKEIPADPGAVFADKIRAKLAHS
jgi:glycosyltransferase involved in cell wall biosynthesis